MKKKILLPILLLATMSLGGALVACDPGSNQPTSSTQSQYKVAIDNKAALEGEWYEGDAKDLELTLTPEANALQELQNKNLTVTSSDETVVKVTGLGLTALKEGTAKITVDYRGAKEEVNVTILSKSAKKKYGVAHEGTAEDPFTNEDALAVAKSEKYAGEVYYVKGIVASFYNAPGSRDDGMVAYFLEPATAGGEKFEIYKCFKENNGKLTDDDIWVGGEATAYGAFTKYNNQYETSSATFVSCTGEKPQPRQTLTKTFAETLAAGVALDDGASTWDYYKFQGYVTVKAGNDYYLTATKGEALTPGKSDEAHGAKDIKGTNAIELYGAGKVEALAAKLLEGAKVEVTMIVKNYHGTVENGLALVDADVTVLEAGTAWAVPEPAVANKTVTEFVALENNKKAAYSVKATIKAWKNDAADKYGNMTITDGTTDLVIYGCSATATALAWDGAGEYAFTNPQDFLTNEVTKDLKLGTEITMKLIRADYTNSSNVTTIQGTGVITAVKAPDAPTLESFTLDYSGLTNDKNSEITTDALEKLGQGNAHVTAVTASKIYCNTGSGGAFPTANGMVKGGTGSANGSIAFTLDVDVVKVEVKCHDFYKKDADHPTNSNSVQVNDLAAQLAPYTEDGTFGTLEFELAAGSKSITIETQKRVYIKEITFYYAASGDTPVAPVQEWDAAAIKTAIAGGTPAEATGHYEADGTETFTAYKISTAGMTITLNYNSAEAQHVKLELKLATKNSNTSRCGIWWQLPNNAASDIANVVQKTEVSLGGQALPVPEEKSLNYDNLANYNPAKSPDAKDGSSSLCCPVWVKVIELDLAAGDNTIVVKYLDGGYSYWVAGAQLVK
ncbi:MAG: hypothetical protein J5617_01945 [Bacilli bacterium]|nr:hypothetical protein [Bacilli bacterium]